MSNWLYESTEVTENRIPTDAIGFVYMIIHIPSGKYYIGKKQLFTNRKVRIGKRELQSIKQERKDKKITGRLPVKKAVCKSSDWQDYYSSNEWINEQIDNGKKDEFKRTIIQFCKSIKALTYYEMYWQIKYNVLTDDMSLNDNITGKFFRKDLI